MKRIVSLFALTAVLPLMGETPPPEILQAEIQELHTVLKSLRAENEKLRRENRQLRAQLEGKAPRPVPTPFRPRNTSSGQPPMTSPTRVQPPRNQPPRSQPQGPKILSVNPDWGTLIVAAGSNQGMKKGLEVHILRGGQVLGKAVVTEVKSKQALLEFVSSSLTRSGVYPAAGDVVALP